MTCETCKNQCDCKSSEAFTRLPKFGDTKGSEYEPDTMTDNKIVKALEDAEYKVNGVVTQGVYLSVETFNAVVDLINRLQAENERLKSELADISTRTLKKFEKEIKDVKFTLGQTWEIQCALKKVLKEMSGENNE